MQNVNVSSVRAPVLVKWDPKNLEIRTRTVERTLEPLVIQVSNVDSNDLCRSKQTPAPDGS